MVRDSLDSIATRYRPDGPGIESQCVWRVDEIFRARADRIWGPTRLPVQ